MTTDWNALDAELQLWTQGGLDLPIWWRDDDAVAPSDALDRLEALSTQIGLPVHLAVIPQPATEDLAERVAGSSQFIPVVHGWAHANHAAAGQKKAEFPAERAIDAALMDAEQGIERLTALFGTGLQPMFVPPWNRLSPKLALWLAGLGYEAVSTYGPRQRVAAGPGLLQINTHVDPIDWHGSRGLRPIEEILANVLQDLRARRLGHADTAEPFGLLTHHLVHDTAIWAFCEEFLTRILAGPGRVWPGLVATREEELI